MRLGFLDITLMHIDFTLSGYILWHNWTMFSNTQSNNVILDHRCWWQRWNPHGLKLSVMHIDSTLSGYISWIIFTLSGYISIQLNELFSNIQSNIVNSQSHFYLEMQLCTKRGNAPPYSEINRARSLLASLGIVLLWTRLHNLDVTYCQDTSCDIESQEKSNVDDNKIDPEPGTIIFA